MVQVKNRIISLDGDEVEVAFTYDSKRKVWNGDYPDFEEEPKFTPNGRPWVNVISDACAYAASESEDCGSCKYLIKNSPTDLIGICVNQKMKKPSSKKEGKNL